MRKHIDIQQTFKAIRNLPVSISFQQVEQWIKEEANKSKKQTGKINWWFPKWFDN